MWCNVALLQFVGGSFDVFAVLHSSRLVPSAVLQWFFVVTEVLHGTAVVQRTLFIHLLHLYLTRSVPLRDSTCCLLVLQPSLVHSARAA